IHASPWHGRKADRFRHQWDGEYRRSIGMAAQFLDEAAEILRRNAREQRDASGVGGGGGGYGGTALTPADLEWLKDVLDGLFPGGGGPGDGGFDLFGLLEDVQGNLDMVIGAIGGLYGVAAARTITYLRAGKQIVAWRSGQAAAMSKVFGSAKDVARYARHLDRLGKGLAVAGGVLAGIGQWQSDGSYATGERAARAAAVGVARTGGYLAAGATGAYIGGAIGTAIPIPVVGTVVGAAVGFGVGYGAGWVMDNTGFDEAAADIGSGIYKGGSAVVHGVADVGGSVISGGKDLAEGGFNMAKKGLGALWP
ncbi:MAG: hypothetical protein JWM47_1987, partial [Acidimicrobiales bacterium]|nr:hypothetical protein [Acidimicrobiales bacterium]